jgi:hypothetical protein
MTIFGAEMPVGPKRVPCLGSRPQPVASNHGFLLLIPLVSHELVPIFGDASTPRTTRHPDLAFFTDSVNDFEGLVREAN